MTGPAKTVSFVSLRPQWFPRLHLGEHWGSRGNKIHCFPRGQSLWVYYLVGAEDLFVKYKLTLFLLNSSSNFLLSFLNFASASRSVSSTSCLFSSSYLASNWSVKSFSNWLTRSSSSFSWSAAHASLAVDKARSISACVDWVISRRQSSRAAARRAYGKIRAVTCVQLRNNCFPFTWKTLRMKQWLITCTATLWILVRGQLSHPRSKLWFNYTYVSGQLSWPLTYELLVSKGTICCVVEQVNT